MRVGTLESGINVATGKFGKKNLAPFIPYTYIMYLNRLNGVRNKAMFIPDSRVGGLKMSTFC